MPKLTAFLEEEKPGSKITLLVPGLEGKLTYKSARAFLDKLLKGLPDREIRAVKPEELERIKNFMQAEIETRLHNNWMLIKAIEEYQTKETQL